LNTKDVKATVLGNTVGGTVGGAVCPRQLPLLIETSSMAMSPVKDVPAIPSNVTYKDR